MANEVYVYDSETNIGSFRPATREDRIYYRMPDQSNFGLHQPPKGEEKGVVGRVMVFRDGIIEHKRGGILGFGAKDDYLDEFPPGKAGIIYRNGTLEPQNLVALVQERVDAGWNITPQLKGLLFGQQG